MNEKIYDIFYDSRSYHFKGIYYLKEGWNPIYHFSPCSAFTPCDYVKYVEHYPKAYWIVSAVFYKIFNTIGSTHLPNFIMAFSSLGISYIFGRRLLKLKIWFSLLFAIIISLNPTSMWQAFSNYIDGTLVSSLLIILFSLLIYFENHQKKWLFLSMLYIPFLVNLKFTGLVYGCFLCFGLLGYHLIFIKKKVESKKLFIVGLGVFILSYACIGFNPYISNIITKKNTFYPANSGKNGSIISGQASETFIEKNRFQKVFISLFSVGKKSKPLEPVYERIFARTSYWPKVSTRFSGNGPWFSGLLVLSLFLAFFLNARGWFILGIIWATVFITSAGWYARLCPQIWWIPIFHTFGSVSHTFSRDSSFKKTRNILLILLSFGFLLNIWWVGSSSQRVTIRHGILAEKYLQKNNDITYIKSPKRRDRQFYLHAKELIKEKKKSSLEVESCNKDGLKYFAPYRGIAFCSE